MQMATSQRCECPRSCARAACTAAGERGGFGAAGEGGPRTRGARGGAGGREASACLGWAVQLPGLGMSDCSGVRRCKHHETCGRTSAVRMGGAGSCVGVLRKVAARTIPHLSTYAPARNRRSPWKESRVTRRKWETGWP